MKSCNRSVINRLRGKGVQMKFFTADIHFSDALTMKTDNRPFKNIKEYDKFIVSNCNKMAKKGDTIYVVGDLLDCDGPNTNEWKIGLKQVEKINADIVLIMGNNEDRVVKYFFDNSFNGFLHVIEDGIEIYNDPTTFLSEIEKMMSKLHLKSWFNTVTDVCNYSFNIYNPRFSVDLDEPTVKEVYDKTIYWTSHANTSWVCYDYSIATFDDVSFNESFTIAMFYIITFLAERRNHKKDGELYYMNFYPSIKDELGVFRLLQNVKDKPSSDVEYSKQNEIFRNMNVNYTADMSIEKVMDDIFDILTKNISN